MGGVKLRQSSLFLFPTTAGVTGAESETVINKRSNDVGR